MTLNAAQKVRLEAIISQNLNGIKDNEFDEGIDDSQALFAFQAVLVKTITPERESILKTWGVWDNIATIRSFIEHPAPQNRVEHDEYLMMGGGVQVPDPDPDYVYYMDTNEAHIGEQKGLLNLSAKNTVIINPDYVDPMDALQESVPDEEAVVNPMDAGIDALGGNSPNVISSSSDEAQASPPDENQIDNQASAQLLVEYPALAPAYEVQLDSHVEVEVEVEVEAKADPILPVTKYIVDDPVTKEDVTTLIGIEVNACIEVLQEKGITPFGQVAEYLQDITAKGYVIEDFETLYDGGLEFAEVNALLGLTNNQEAVNGIFSHGRGEALQWAIQKNSSNIVHSLLEDPTNNTRIPDQDKTVTLLWAAEQGHLGSVNKVIAVL